MEGWRGRVVCVPQDGVTMNGCRHTDVLLLYRRVHRCFKDASNYT